VYLHGCDGLSENQRKGIAETHWGYVSLSVDSYSTRGIKQTCGGQWMPARQGDALGALLYLSKLPFVDPQRIAIVGASQGGFVALEIASTHSVDLFAIPDGLKFKAAVAYYPLCSFATQTLSIPTVILIGELDDRTPSKNCERWMALRAGKGGARQAGHLSWSLSRFCGTRPPGSPGWHAILWPLGQIRCGRCAAFVFGSA
jgi:dienelactone hydrolase